MIPGIQLSTFRPLLTNADQVADVLRKIAALGCRTVQLQGIDPAVPIPDIVEALRQAGIRAVSVQEIYAVFQQNRDYYLRLNQAVGGDWLTVSRIPEGADLGRFAKDLKALAADLSSLQQKLAFHPVYEDYPFIDDLLSRVPEMDICLDFYHLWRTGEKLPDWVSRYRARVRMAHFKDAVNGRMVPAGQGQVDWTGVPEACAQVDYGFVEQEAWDTDPFLCAKEALEWLRRGCVKKPQSRMAEE